jgi:CubicO group peptidase (beta-lactamase class C family)
LQETLFDPLGMVDTAFNVPEAKCHRLATMYGLPALSASNSIVSKLVESEVRRPTSSTSFARGGGGLFSTAADYLHFAQMLLNQGQSGGVRILGRKTVSMMHLNHLPPKMLPITQGGRHLPGRGYGLSCPVLMDVAEFGTLGSVGAYFGSGAAKTHYWVDPKEELIYILMTQDVGQVEQPDADLRVLAYQALID